MRGARPQSSEITLRLPLPVFLPLLAMRIREATALFASSMRTLSGRISRFSASRLDFGRKYSIDSFKRWLPPGIVLLVLIGALVVAVRVFRAATRQNPSDSRVTVRAARATRTLSKQIAVPIKDANGKEVTKAKFLFDTAELRDEIIVNGQKAVAISGRTFLILSVKITNDYDKALELNVRDFVRLSLNGNDKEWLAADIHNDPVNVRPASTKTTRLGFPINETDKNLVLRLGEVDGDKQTVTLSFNR